MDLCPNWLFRPRLYPAVPRICAIMAVSVWKEVKVCCASSMWSTKGLERLDGQKNKCHVRAAAVPGSDHAGLVRTLPSSTHQSACTRASSYISASSKWCKQVSRFYALFWYLSCCDSVLGLILQHTNTPSESPVATTPQQSHLKSRHPKIMLPSRFQLLPLIDTDSCSLLEA